MTTQQIAMLISWLGTIVAVFFAIKGNKRTDNCDLEKSVAERTRTEMKLDALIEKVEEIKESLSRQETKISTLMEKYGQVDAKAEKLHARVDELTHRIGRLEEKLLEGGEG